MLEELHARVPEYEVEGLEVDFLVPGPGASVSLIECKAARTVRPSDAASMQRLTAAAKENLRKGTAVEMFLVHQPRKVEASTQAVAPGVRSLSWPDFLREL